MTDPMTDWNEARRAIAAARVALLCARTFEDAELALAARDAAYQAEEVARCRVALWRLERRRPARARREAREMMRAEKVLR